MNSLIVLAVISMAALASAGTLLGGAALTTGPLATTSLVSPLGVHQANVLSAPWNSGVLASPSWVGSPLLQRTVSTHGVLGSPWLSSSAIVAQPTLVHGGLVGARTIW
ncbi:uncharacterized protein LOC123684221 [Harmonia axyridis]|uniref:uncharacterized protein LOC123684221 n=1 Tax=Harmonia axyridis TaxID=115357 RepID=UPI001E277397|nr:uncharacterized protein LOC123684221 [Harmonia axyridis]